jgi:hypothetical protein
MQLQELGNIFLPVQLCLLRPKVLKEMALELAEERRLGSKERRSLPVYKAGSQVGLRTRGAYQDIICRFALPSIISGVSSFPEPATDGRKV